MSFRKIRNTLFLVFLAIITLSWLPFIKRKKLSNEAKQAIDRIFSTDTRSPAKVSLIESGPDALKLRIALIQKAEESIDISYYRIDPSSEASKIFYGALLEASKRGVRIRLVVDAKLGGVDKETVSLLTTIDNLELYFYNPLSQLKVTNLQTTLHNKFIIVDNHYILSGGRNIKDSFFELLESEKDVSLDLDLFIECNEQSKIYSDFDWLRQQLYESSQSRRMNDRPTSKTLIHKKEIVKSYQNYIRNNEISLEDYLTRLHEVQTIRAIHNDCNLGLKEPRVAYALMSHALKSGSIKIQTPYATADKNIIKILKQLGDTRKVDFYTNSLDSSPNFPAYSNYWSQRHKFLNTNINLFEYQNGPNVSVHTKAYLFDEWLAIGSFNLDNRSMNINTETMIFIKDSKLHEELKQSMASIEMKSVNVTQYGAKYSKDFEGNVSFLKKILMRISSIFSRVFQSLI